MKGLEISVTNSDLVIKQEERLVRLFVMFKDKNYGTKYIVFADKDGKELYYGSPLINGTKMVIMKFKNIKDEEVVKEFVWNYLNGESISKFELIELTQIEKLEIIDNNKLDAKDEYIDKLNDIFFKKEEVIYEDANDVKIIKKKNNGPILFTLILILIAVVGFIYLKNNPELIYGKDIYVQCKIDYIVSEVDANVNEVVTLTFNNSQILKKHEKDVTYSFNDNDKYYEFKEKNLNYVYLNEEGLEKFSDEELSYILFVDYDLTKDYVLPKDYDELYDYYKNNNYSCNNIEK